MGGYPYNSLEHHDMMSSQLDRLLAKARNLKGSPASESVDQLLANAVSLNSKRAAAAADSAYVSTTRAVGATPLVPVVVPRKLEYLARANGRTATYGPTKVISVDRGDSQYGLGITIAGGADTELGALFVAHVFPGSIADLDGRIWEGDRILSLNYVDTFDLTQLELVDLLESIKGAVDLGLIQGGSARVCEALLLLWTLSLCRVLNWCRAEFALLCRRRGRHGSDAHRQRPVGGATTAGRHLGSPRRRNLGASGSGCGGSDGRRSSARVGATSRGGCGTCGTHGGQRGI